MWETAAILLLAPPVRFPLTAREAGRFEVLSFQVSSILIAAGHLEYPILPQVSYCEFGERDVRVRTVVHRRPELSLGLANFCEEPCGLQSGRKSAREARVVDALCCTDTGAFARDLLHLLVDGVEAEG